MSDARTMTRLIAEARKVRARAYAPYSKYRVGAAIQTRSGAIFTGCNVENASYGLTMCAERNAIAQLVAQGKKLLAVAIVVDSKRPTPPCGMCRQVMAEFATAALEVRSRTPPGDAGALHPGRVASPRLHRRIFLERFFMPRPPLG